MKTKNILGLLVLFVMSGLFGAKAQSVVHPKAYYDAITYEWTDATGVTHTNAITDEATNPYQIVALLKKVYCDPNIPGPRYTAYDENGNREREVYYGAVEGGWNISAGDVTPPYEEGYTILMVALNNTITRLGTDMEQMISNSWLFGPSYKEFKSNFFTSTNELIDYISDNVTSVQLLCDGLRIGEGTMSGTTFNISGEYNRFFVLSKGQSRQKDSWVLQEESNYDYPVIAGERVPFKSMFEQFSPTDGSENSQITDFYAKMMSGELYPVIHDCASVIESEHEFSMSGKTGTEYKSLTGMNIFIPDYRLQYWVNDEFYIHYTNGNTEGPYTVDGRTMNPYKRLNGTNFRDPGYLAANYAQYNLDHSPQLGIYTIKLEANDQPADADETYTVLLDWTSSLNTMANGSVPQDYIIYIVTSDDEGNISIEEVTTVVNDTHYEYTVPQYEHSYTITYVIYGMPNDGEHDVFVAWSNEADVIIPGWNDFLNLTVEHYESDFDKTEQCNYYRNYLQMENEDILNPLSIDDLVEEPFTNDFTLYRYEANTRDDMIPVATMYVTTNGSTVNYTVEYENQVLRPNYNVPVTTSGTLTTDDQGALDLSSIMFVDQFSASVEDNAHPSRYGYVVTLSQIDMMPKSTNHIEVPVLKAASDLDGYYSEDEIMDDTDAHLTVGVKNANVKMNLLPNTHVYYYTLERGDNSAANDLISKLQRRSDNTYMEMSNALSLAGNLYDASMIDIFDNNVLTGTAGDYMDYQPVIWAFGDDRVNNDGENSYGMPNLMTGVGSADITVHGVCTEGETGVWKDENNQECCIFYPTISVSGLVPEYASVGYEPYMFRVWRECNSIRGYYVNESGKPVNDPNADRDPKKLIIEEQTTNGVLNDMGGYYNVNPYGFGAVKDANISFRVRFYYKKEVPELRDGAPMFYVVEGVFDWNNIPTGIYELNARQEVSKTYFNAQGVSSDKPFDGVNIVVTTYSDGSTYTSKVVR